MARLTCFDCKHNAGPSNGEHGFCEIHRDPIGGLHWNNEMFENCPSHIFPRAAERCKHFEPIRQRLVRCYKAMRFGGL